MIFRNCVVCSSLNLCSLLRPGLRATDRLCKTHTHTHTNRWQCKIFQRQSFLRTLPASRLDLLRYVSLCARQSAPGRAEAAGTTPGSKRTLELREGGGVIHGCGTVSDTSDMYMRMALRSSQSHRLGQSSRSPLDCCHMSYTLS